MMFFKGSKFVKRQFQRCFCELWKVSWQKVITRATPGWSLVILYKTLICATSNQTLSLQAIPRPHCRLQPRYRLHPDPSSKPFLEFIQWLRQREKGRPWSQRLRGGDGLWFGPQDPKLHHCHRVAARRCRFERYQVWSHEYRIYSVDFLTRLSWFNWATCSLIFLLSHIVARLEGKDCKASHLNFYFSLLKSMLTVLKICTSH